MSPREKSDSQDRMAFGTLAILFGTKNNTADKCH